MGALGSSGVDSTCVFEKAVVFPKCTHLITGSRWFSWITPWKIDNQFDVIGVSSTLDPKKVIENSVVT